MVVEPLEGELPRLISVSRRRSHEKTDLSDPVVAPRPSPVSSSSCSRKIRTCQRSARSGKTKRGYTQSTFRRAASQRRSRRRDSSPGDTRLTVEVKNFSGKIEVSERDETRIAVEVEAETKSLTNADEGMTEFERREFHNVLNNSVLESDKFPMIKFVSVSVSDARKSGETRSFTLNGDLTMRDVTKRVSFPVTVTISKDQLRATGDAELKQTDFGIKPYSGKLGMIRIGDEVKINFAIVAKSP